MGHPKPAIQNAWIAVASWVVEKPAAAALFNANVASYRQTVLAAFQQVEDSMVTVRILSKQIQQQQLAERTAERYLELAQARYETGVDQYLNVLVAQTTLLNDQQQLASLRPRR